MSVRINERAMHSEAPPQPVSIGREDANSNTLLAEDLPVHGWYRFVLSYPPHLVRKYTETFRLGPDSLLLDPFAGTGTTLVEAMKLGIPAIGCDAHPFAAMVSRVKTDWSIPGQQTRTCLGKIVADAERRLESDGLGSLSMEPALFADSDGEDPAEHGLSEDEAKLIPTGFLSSRPLRRLLAVRDAICAHTADDSATRRFFLVALAHAIANGAGNFAFGPEIYRTKAKADYDVVGHFARQTSRMLDDIQKFPARKHPSAQILLADARDLSGVPDGISTVITSPPYPNEKDYTRTTRVESILLGIIADKAGLRDVKERLLRSNTRNVFVNDRDGDEVAGFESIQSICRAIEERRIELGKTSGFEKMYHRVVAHYFGGMRRHFRALYPKLRRRARLAYVVGDQLSFLMVPVPTSRLLGEVAEAEGFRITGCDLWRERIGTKVRNSKTDEKTVRVREDVLLLEKP